jgi:hypothetical protein
MKRLFLTLFISFTAFFIYAQMIPRTQVILEIATGTWCQYCPGAALGADSLLHTGANVAIIEYHNGDPYANTASNARNSYYNVPGYPNDQFDGPNTSGVGGDQCGQGTTFNYYQSMYNQRIAVQSPLNIDISGTNSGNVYNIVLSIKKTSTVSGTNLKAFLVLTESDITTSSAWPPSFLCMTKVEFVERVMVPDEFGTSMSFDGGDFQVVNLSFTKDPSWVSANCELVAFVQDYGTKEIYNGTKVALNALPASIPVSFTGVPTTSCVPFNVNYTTSGAGVNSYQWNLPGATPNTSSVQNPTVSYATAGTYDATLTAWNSTLSRGNKMVIPGYVSALAAPAAPAQPTGTSGMCVNPPDQTYTITAVPTATSYTWDLQPASSGVITPNGTSCSINWDNTFQGGATLKVKASNTCGDGLFSLPLAVTISPQPGIPGTPTGPVQLCVNSDNTTYMTSGTSPATAYTWELLPSTAGTLTTNWTSATVDWSPTYSGTAQIHVMATNNGCSGNWSEFLNITLNAGPGQYNVTGGGTYCATSGSGMSVGLAGSQLNTNYTLYKDGVATSTVVAGTGGAISFGTQTNAGTYTVQGTSTVTNCSMVMNGSAIVAVDPQAPGTPGTPQGPGEPNAGTSSTYTTTGGTYATSYDWSVSPASAGAFTGSTTSGIIEWSSVYSGPATIKVQGVNTCGSGSYSQDFSVTVLPAIGIHDQAKQKLAVFSPNPAKDKILIITNSRMKADLSIYNSMGIQVMEKTGITFDGTYSLDISSLSPGMYFFSLNEGNLNQTEKIIIGR